MIMGQCVRGYFMRLPQQAHLIKGSNDACAKAVTLLDGANSREKMHVSALQAWCEGDIRRTNSIWEQILVENPHDILEYHADFRQVFAPKSNLFDECHLRTKLGAQRHASSHENLLRREALPPSRRHRYCL